MSEFEADRTLLHSKANEALDKNLLPGETVKVIIRGPSNQAIIGTERRAFVFKKGFLAGASFGSELTEWQYSHLVGVQIHTGMMTGAVILQGPGQSGKSTSHWGHDDDDPYKVPNAIPISRPYALAEAGVARLRELIHDSQHAPSAAQVAPTAVPEASSIADELTKLAALRDSGVLSEDEFLDLKLQLIQAHTPN